MSIHKHLPAEAIPEINAAIDTIFAASPGTAYTPTQLEPLVNPIIAWDAAPEALVQVIGALLHGRSAAGTMTRDEGTGMYALP